MVHGDSWRKYWTRFRIWGGSNFPATEQHADIRIDLLHTNVLRLHLEIIRIYGGIQGATGFDDVLEKAKRSSNVVRIKNIQTSLLEGMVIDFYSNGVYDEAQ